MDVLLVDKSPEVYYDFREHSHGFWEIICNIQGSGTALIDGREYPFCEGTIFCVPPGVRHRKIASGGFRDACLFLREYTPVDTRPITVFEDDSRRTFENLLLTAYEIQLRDEPNAKAIINSLGDALYQLLVGWSSRGRQPADPVDDFLDLLMQNISNDCFNLTEAIRKTSYSESYFRKIFKGYTGYAPLDYLHHLRIETAKRQLQQYHGIVSIKSIALACGYSDPYYFSRVFKKHEGISPQGYIDKLGHVDFQQMFDGQSSDGGRSDIRARLSSR